MTQRPDDKHMELVAGYVDGTLDEAQRRNFELALDGDPALRAELDFQRRLDGSLTRLFDFDVAGAIGPGTARPAVAASTTAQHSRWRLAAWIAAAAALLLAAGVTFYMMQPPSNPNLLTPDQVYARMELTHFTPQWKCENDQQFIDTVQQRLGEGMLVPADTPGLQVVGWGYSSNYNGYPITPNSMILITKKDNDNILLMVDRAADDRKLKVKNPNLHLFRDTVGGLVLYELTPRTEPVVIPIAKANTPKPGCTSPNGKP
jgi:hypothetical protein